jgi:preprotein translocase subunit SecD
MSNETSRGDDFATTLTEILTSEADGYSTPTFDAYAIADRAGRPTRLRYKSSYGIAAGVIAVAVTAATVIGLNNGSSQGGGPVGGGQATTVTYSAADGTSPDVVQQVLKQLRARVTADHLKDVTLTASGTSVLVTGPVKDAAVLASLGKTNAVTFRIVVSSRTSAAPSAGTPGDPVRTSPAPGMSGSGPTPQAAPDAKTQQLFESIDCAKPPKGYGDVPNDHFAVACSLDKAIVYLLAPADVTGADIVSAVPRAQTTPTGITTGNWEVALSLKDPGKTAFGKVTAQLVVDQGQFAIDVDGVVYSAPTASAAITDGNAQIPGNFSKQTATDLASALVGGALPVPVTVTPWSGS